MSEDVAAAGWGRDVAMEAGEEPDDSGYGAVMFFVFSAAVLLVSLTVCVLALVRSWWVLGGVVSVHLIVTAIVMWVVYHAFELSAESDTDTDELPAETVLPQSAAGRRVMGAVSPGALVAHH